MQLKTIISVGDRALDAVSESFSPRVGASPKEVRINGAICVGIGIFFFACFGAVSLTYSSNAVLILPVMMGYAFVIVGGYRLVFGASAKASPYEVMSLSRILFGVAWIVLVFGAPIAIGILLGY